MLYHLDCIGTEHALATEYFIKEIYKNEISILDISNNGIVVEEKIKEIFSTLCRTATKKDVVSINFIIEKETIDKEIIKLYKKLQKKTTIVLAAGNQNAKTDEYFPTNLVHENTHVVASLNKSGNITQFSNYNNISAYVTGTNQNYISNGKINKMSGTSVSSAYYAAILLSDKEEAIKICLDKKITVRSNLFTIEAEKQYF